MSTPPHSLSQLRVSVLADRQLTQELERYCVVLPAGDPTAHLSLLESGAVADRAADAASLDPHTATVRSAIWVTHGLDVDRLPPAAIRSSAAVFGTDPPAAALIEQQVGRHVGVLPLAARLPIPTTTEPPPRDGPIVYFGAFQSDWSDAVRAQAEALLDAASDLAEVVIDASGNVDGLPARFQRRLRPGGESGALAGARAIIAFPGPAPAPAVPSVVFDALAAGIPVLMTPSVTARLLLPTLVDYASNRAWARKRLAEFLSDEATDSARVPAARLAVAHAHTLPARLATVASALGYAVLPPVPPRLDEPVIASSSP